MNIEPKLDLHYESVERRARPARIAVLIDKSDPNWQWTALHVIEFFSSLWGGKHSVIVPTDGATIDPYFWEILERFSPDYVYVYCRTLNDEYLDRPEEYAARLRSITSRDSPDQDWTRGAEELIDRQLRSHPVESLSITSDFRRELAERLVPFHHEQHFGYITSESLPNHPLTQIFDVLPNVERPASFVGFTFSEGVDPLWCAAYTGKYSTSAQRLLEQLPFAGSTISVTSKRNLESFSRWVSSGTSDDFDDLFDTDDGAQRITLSTMDIARTPFALSMLGTSYYGTAASNLVL